MVDFLTLRCPFEALYSDSIHFCSEKVRSIKVEKLKLVLYTSAAKNSPKKIEKGKHFFLLRAFIIEHFLKQCSKHHFNVLVQKHKIIRIVHADGYAF